MLYSLEMSKAAVQPVKHYVDGHDCIMYVQLTMHFAMDWKVFHVAGAQLIEINISESVR